MTVAARATTERKTLGHLSSRVATRRQSFSLPNMISILMGPDPATIFMLKRWTAEVQSHGTAIYQIARKLNEAKLLGRSLPYSAEDEAAIRALIAFTFTLIAEFRALWNAKREAMSREIDEAPAGLKTGGHTLDMYGALPYTSHVEETRHVCHDTSQPDTGKDGCPQRTAPASRG